MEFAISGVVISPILLASVGFFVGILGGFFGVGGGFLAGPMMFLSGVPMNFVVGTDLAHMTGKSIVAARRHRTLGNVDIKLGILMVAGTIPGVEIGAQIIEALKKSGSVDLFVGIAYVTILLMISLFTARESMKSLRMNQSDVINAKDVMKFDTATKFLQKINLPPMVPLPRSGIKQISLWLILGVGFITGILAGILGVGGGFLRFPMMIYLLGIPTHVAVGTDLFEIMFSAGFGTLTHALKGNVDIMMALIMHTGAALGAQIGAILTRFFSGPHIRLYFSILPLIGSILVIYQLLNGVPSH